MADPNNKPEKQNPEIQEEPKHKADGIQKWDKIEIELRLKTANVRGKEVSVPYEFYAIKVLQSNMIGADVTFQKMNKQTDFRLTSRPNYHVYMFPAGTVEPAKTYKCDIWFETVGKGVNESQIDRILFVGNERATGAPVTKK